MDLPTAANSPKTLSSDGMFVPEPLWVGFAKRTAQCQMCGDCFKPRTILGDDKGVRAQYKVHYRAVHPSDM